MMMMEPLRRSQNVFVGLFQTGAKMLGLGLGMGLGGGGGDGGRAKAGGGGEAGAGVTSIFLSGPSDGSSSSSNKVSYHNMRYDELYYFILRML